MRVLLNLILAVVLPIVSFDHAFADDFPSKPIKIIVPFPPGGGSDISTRKIAPLVSERLGQPVVVENRPGAGGNIGTSVGANAAPDGYTVTYTLNTTLCVNPHVYQNAGFDPQRNFAHIIITHRGPGILLVPADSSLRSVADLVRTAKSQPGKLTYGTSGNGSPGHLMSERLSQLAGIELLHIPYKGASQYLAELVSGQLSVAFGFPGPALPLIKASKVRPLAVSSQARLSALPEVPTLAEAGIAGYNEEVWAGFAAPSGTPAQRLRKLHDAFKAALQSASVQTYLDANGYQVVGSTPEDTAALIKSEYRRYGEIVKTLGLRVE